MSSTGGFSTTAKAIEPSFSGEPPSGSDMQSPQPMGEQLSPLPVPGGLQNIWSETGNWVLEDSSQQDTLDFLPESSSDYPSIPPVLCLALGIVGAMFIKNKECSRYGRTLHNKLCYTFSGAILLVSDGNEGTIPILVSMLVTQIMPIYSSEPRKLHYAQQISGIFVSQSHRLKLFSDLENPGGGLAKWIRVEAGKRFAFGIFTES
ncbi:hypothetical protein TRICI_004777 [Trichomonascus ciferrii]|uniref:Uncharacterized protein n=1 Tax=Trichomonascus ciferrii TaxID=44093 RepID=A0A642UZ65_9ASCO|nr:hypothetical protein TRICI_004777 [Trichomonascus ciferrii]